MLDAASGDRCAGQRDVPDHLSQHGRAATHTAPCGGLGDAERHRELRAREPFPEVELEGELVRERQLLQRLEQAALLLVLGVGRAHPGHEVRDRLVLDVHDATARVLLDVRVEDVARRAEHVCPEGAVLADAVATLHACEERVLHEVLDARGDLVAKEADERGDVPIEQHAARALVPGAPALEELDVVRPVPFVHVVHPSKRPWSRS
jgi:hypothetical protein